jgi:hypothetical protein
MKIRYIVSTRPNLDINFTQINFLSKIIVIKIIKMLIMFTPMIRVAHIFGAEKLLKQCHTTANRLTPT